MKIIIFILLFISSSAFAGWTAGPYVRIDEYYSGTQEGACTNRYNITLASSSVHNFIFNSITEHAGQPGRFICRWDATLISSGTFMFDAFVAFLIEINPNCVLPKIEDPVSGLCVSPAPNCFGAYNDLDPLLPGVQCVSPKSSGQPNPLTCNGNPCDASTGNKFQMEVDYTSNTLNFTRYYNSLHPSESVLGKQWTHDYLGSLTIDTTIKINRADGKVLEFYNENGDWLSDTDITETLTQVGTNWEFKTSNDSIELYNDLGQLLSVTTRDNKVTAYTYNSNDLLEILKGPYNRTFTFVYDASNRLITLTTPENTQIHYNYDINNNLISVTYPDDTPGDLTNNPTKIYHYENANFQNYLTGITNENGNRYATWAYNTAGLAILSEHNDSAEKVELVYNTDETTTVTNALGQVKIYTFEPLFGLRKPSSIQYTYNDGKQSVTKQKSYTYYPENGRVKTIIDYNGNITYFEYNNRGLITLETQGKDTSESYTVTTTWHPTYRLPATRTYPDKIETYSYNSTGQLINTQTTKIQ